MKLNYVLFAPYPNERAYSVQITEFTNALSRLGVEVSVYGFKKRVRFNNKVAAYISFRMKCVFLLARLLLTADIDGSWIFMRDPSHVRMVKRLFPKSKIILEIHYLSQKQRNNAFLLSLSEKTEKIIFLTETARAQFQLIDSHTLHDGTSCERCLHSSGEQNSKTYTAILKDINQNKNHIKIGYFGSFSTLNQSKGVKEFAKLYNNDPSLSQWSFYFIGGTNEEVNELSQKYVGNLKFFERVTYSEAQILMKRFDCLLLLETQSDFSNVFSSPLKLFDYLKMNKPIISPRIAPILEVVQDHTNGVHFIDLNNVCSIKNAIEKALIIDTNELNLTDIANTYCWCARARNIIDWMGVK